MGLARLTVKQVEHLDLVARLANDEPAVDATSTSCGSASVP